jgi:hypothetical protein
MNRREFIALIGGGATWPLAARGAGELTPMKRWVSLT